MTKREQNDAVSRAFVAFGLSTLCAIVCFGVFAHHLSVRGVALPVFALLVGLTFDALRGPFARFTIPHISPRIPLGLCVGIAGAIPFVHSGLDLFCALLGLALGVVSILAVCAAWAAYSAALHITRTPTSP